MSRRTLSLKARVRYEGRAQIFDRRATLGADLDKLPDPMWYTVGHILRSSFKSNVPKRPTTKRKLSALLVKEG